MPCHALWHGLWLASGQWPMGSSDVPGGLSCCPVRAAGSSLGLKANAVNNNQKQNEKTESEKPDEVESVDNGAGGLGGGKPRRGGPRGRKNEPGPDGAFQYHHQRLCGYCCHLAAGDGYDTSGRTEYSRL